MSDAFKNWAGTVSARPAAVHRPTSEAELAARLARTDAPVKIVGSMHSWSAIAQPRGEMVLLERLNRFLDLDPVRQEATAEGGIVLADLVEALARQDFQLLNVGSILEQTLAGAISTGTHGSGIAKGNLASAVTRLRIVDASGQIHTCSATENPDLFRAARVGLGALGVITEVTFQVEPATHVEEHLIPLSFEAMLEQLPNLMDDWPWLKVWWLPHTDTAAVFAARPTSDPIEDPSWQRAIDRFTNARVFPSLLWLSNVHEGFARPVNRVVSKTYFKPRRRVNRMDRILTVPMPPLHRETEYAIPVSDTVEALRATRALITSQQLTVNFPFEVRFVKGDDAWLSPAHDRDSAQLGAYQAPSRSLQPWFSGFAQCMDAFQGRPHWGKEHRTTPDRLRETYPKYDAFSALRREMDPRGRFSNAYLDGIFPAAD